MDDSIRWSHKSASYDYFILPIVNSLPEPFFEIKNLHLREINTKKLIEKYFMDDDLLDLRSIFSLPTPYAFRLWRKATSKRKLIFSSRPQLLVSTPYLASKYSKLNPRLLRPIATGPLLERLWANSPENNAKSSRHPDFVRICYHGTWAHRDDMKWLAPVIAEVQRRCTNTIFEIIGGDRVARIFKGIPRVVVLETMNWLNYLKHTQYVRQDIGLAPLRDTAFNRGRGPIKFFDYARAGAIGIYSEGPAFSEFVCNGVDGFVLKNDPSLWVKHIVSLANKPDLRNTMSDAAWLKVQNNGLSSPDIQKYLEGLHKV